MIYTVVDTTPQLIDAFYITAGTHTIFARLGPVTGIGIVTLRVRVAGSFVDELALSNVSAAIEELSDDLVVGVDGWYEVYAEITTGTGLVEFDQPEVGAEAMGITVASVDSTTVRITFDVPVLVNDVLTFTGAYEIVHNVSTERLTVYEVIPDADPAAYVDLTTEEMIQGLNNYTITLHTLEAA